MRRFYQSASAAPVEGGFGVLLDGRPVRTPAKRVLAVPTEALAEALVEEWLAQGETIVPKAMPLTRLANTVQDRVAENPSAVIDEIAGFAGSDLLCYRAEAPAELVLCQAATWDPVVEWLAARYGASLKVATGIVHVSQEPEALARLRAAMAALTPAQLTALHGMTTALGSAALALALAERRLDLEAAWLASRIDEDFQAELWGEDHEAAARAKALRADLEAAFRFFSLAGS